MLPLNHLSEVGHIRIDVENRGLNTYNYLQAQSIYDPTRVRTSVLGLLGIAGNTCILYTHAIELTTFDWECKIWRFELQTELRV